MTRILLIVAMLLLVTPAMAVTITATDQGGGVVAIGYTDGNGIRAFALDITIDNGATMNSISNFKTGESTAASPGFGIFPGRFRDVINPATPNWADPNYNPVAPVGDPDGNDTGLPGNYITVELGSLYVGGPNAPGASGTLFKLNCSGSGDANLCIKKNGTRGNVVKEDANEATVTLPGTGGCIKVAFDCFPVGDPCYQTWKDLGRPNCWCYARQCNGDADGMAQGSTKAGFYYVGENDLTIMLKGWKVLESPKGPGLQGEPNICADFKHDSQGSTKAGIYRVGENDLPIMLANWKVLEPTKGTGVPRNCPAALYPPGYTPPVP